MQYQPRDLIADLAREAGWHVQYVDPPPYWLRLTKDGCRLDAHIEDLVWIARENYDANGEVSHGPEIFVNLARPGSILDIQEYLRDICPT